MQTLLNRITFCFVLFHLFVSVVSADSAHITWTGAGSDSLASTPDNWTNNVLPQDGDDVVFDGLSSKDCVWDMNINLSTLTVDEGYAGSITQNSDIKTTGSLSISGGSLALNNDNMFVGFSIPTATTDSAGNVNGNAATLYATVNPNGLETTVYFECGTDASYGINTNEQSIGQGTTDVSVSSDITDLSPDTLYQCRVVVENAYGTVYGDDIFFTTPPITLLITTPSDSSAINRPDVMVKGTVSNSTGNETGVTVNGIVAVVFNGEFFVNHVPLQDGSNSITATAIDVAGNSVTTAVSVSADTGAHYVTLRGNNEAGIAMLTVYFNSTEEIPAAVAGYQIDFEGDGSIDYSGETFEDIHFNYDAEGVYFPTLTITDDQSNSYTDTIAIVIFSGIELDSLLMSKWTAMTDNLSASDISAALTYIHFETRDLYSQIFSAVSDQLPAIMATQSALTQVSIIDNEAEYTLETFENSTVYSYEVIFKKDTDGIWRVKEF